MEIADIFVVNKSDRDGADRVVQAVAANLSLQTFQPEDWRPPIVKTEATTGTGIDRLWAEIVRFREHSADRRTARRRVRQEARLREILAQRFQHYVEAALPAGAWPDLVERMARRDTDPYSAADEVMAAVLHPAASVDGAAGSPRE